MRLLIILAVIYLCYKFIKSWTESAKGSQKTVDRKGEMGVIDDVMVKDPFCNVYFPKRNGVHARVDGKDLYFCSKACRNKFIEAGPT